MAKVKSREATEWSVRLPKSRFVLSREAVLSDYRIAYRSRILSVIGRREVLSGKAKFGIFGDGKEVPQLAIAKAFRKGDWRAGYYRDQTFMLATGMTTVREQFAQLYADPDLDREPASGGRNMNAHFATRVLDKDGNWTTQIDAKNSMAGYGAVAVQMAGMLGLAYASKLYRQEPGMRATADGFSNSGNEVVFGAIGNASTSEGIFFEAVNAAGVLQVPLIISVWDDWYGISVPNEYQTIKSSISEALAGFAADKKQPGLDIHAVKGWEYLALCDTYILAAESARRDHAPALVHVTELTQPLGHSTSGSHERYKSKERLAWEKDHDCVTRMREWMIAEGVATSSELEEIEAEEKQTVESDRKASKEAYLEPIRAEQDTALSLINRLEEETSSEELSQIFSDLRTPPELNRRLVASSLAKALISLRETDSPLKQEIADFHRDYIRQNRERYRSHLYSQSADSPLKVEEIKPTYSEDSKLVDGRVVLVKCFDHHFANDPRLFVVGEDVGKIGDVNLVFEGLQEKYGELRVTDTGIRETTIVGQAIGAAMRGLRPIADIQYLDYFLFALEITSDDLATIHFRTAGGQKAPVIIRTKGHRLMGITHAGSPMGAILHSCRGMYLCVPRDMTRAAGMYNTLLRGDNPAMVIEVLSGYRIKEKVPDNVGTFTVPLGVPETIREGTDVSVVTYGPLCAIAMEASKVLASLGIEIEVIDVQTLNPFDIHGRIVDSLRKTNAVLFLDEDVPGGASGYMMREVLERQNGWEHLDTGPRTLTAPENRTPYATDGDYFTKPNQENIVETVYAMMRERRPADFPDLGL